MSEATTTQSGERPETVTVSRETVGSGRNYSMNAIENHAWGASRCCCQLSRITGAVWADVAPSLSAHLQSQGKDLTYWADSRTVNGKAQPHTLAQMVLGEVPRAHLASLYELREGQTSRRYAPRSLLWHHVFAGAKLRTQSR